MTEREFEQLPEVLERVSQFNTGYISLLEFVDCISELAQLNNVVVEPVE